MKFKKRVAIRQVGFLKILGILYINLLILQIKNNELDKEKAGIFNPCLVGLVLLFFQTVVYNRSSYFLRLDFPVNIFCRLFLAFNS
jgi:hypothetical protein